MKPLLRSRLARCAVAAALVTAAFAQPTLAAGNFDATGKYERIVPAQPTQSDDDKIEVLEVFWYGCPHCYSFQPHLARWEEEGIPDDVDFKRMPAIFRKSWLPHAKAYYTAQALGVLDKTHAALFDALHREKRKLNDRESLMKFFAEHGVSEEDFGKTFDSPGVATKVKQAKVMTQRYGVNGVPAVIINGKYRTSGSAAGSYENVLKVIETLAEEERKATVASR